jgi:hypothetical protein
MERQVVNELQQLKEERLALEGAVMQICSSSPHPEWIGLTLIKNYHFIEAINELVRKERALIAEINHEKKSNEKSNSENCSERKDKQC